MEDLVDGRIVYYMVNPLQSRAAVVTHVWNEEGVVNLYIFPDGSFHVENLIRTSVRYNKMKEIDTWHWIPRKW